MKKKMIAMLLACVLVVQNGSYVLADAEITQNDREEGISELDIAEEAEVKEQSEIFTSGSSEVQDDAEEEIAEVFTDGLGWDASTGKFSDDESVFVMKAGSTSVRDIDWNKVSYSDNWSMIDWTGVNWDEVVKDKVNWSAVDWDTIEWVYEINADGGIYGAIDVEKVNWSEVNWGKIDWSRFDNWDTMNVTGEPWKNENTFWMAVEWSQVNWEGMDWLNLDIDKVQMGNSGNGWNNVDWSKVNWKEVDWNKIKKLNDNDRYKVTYTISFPYLDKISNTISARLGGSDYYELGILPSENVKIEIKNSKSVYIVDSTTYDVYFDSTNNTLKYVVHVNGKPDMSFDVQDFFSDNDKKIKLVNKLPALDDLSYWEIDVDESNCNFAVSPENRKPKVIIQAIKGEEKLIERQDFTVQMEDIAPDRCDEKYWLRIYAVKDSKKVSGVEASKGYILRSYTMHYTDVADYYDLIGIPEKIMYGDYGPSFAYSFDDISEHVYLMQKNENIGALPQLPNAENNYGNKEKELLYKDNYLRLEFQYDGKTWTDSFDWQDWRDTHISDIVKVRVSIVVPQDKNQYVKDGEIIPRYLDGSIYGSFRVTPYSLEEVTPNKTPATIPLSKGSYYLAVVNPEETSQSEKGFIFDKVKDTGILGDYVYNGKAQQQDNLKVKVYLYEEGLMAPGWYYWNNPELLNPSYTVEWKNNINAGTASAVISFSGNPGNFNGSIIRYFTIESKEIKEVTVDASDFAYDGNDHLPKLIILDSDTEKVLQEGADKDYTVTVVSGSTKNPGEVVVEITGHGNYKGTTKATYKIISTSSGSTPAAPTIADASRYEITLGTATYNGKAQLPDIEVTDKTAGRKLTAGTDYSVEPVAGADNTNAGIGKARITGITVSGSVERSFIIKAKPLDAAIQTEASDVTYNGKAQLPQVMVTDTVLKTALVQEKDFILYAGTGADNINVGTGSAVIRGIGNYTGTKDVSFKIAEAYTDEGGNTHYADGSIQAPDGSYLKPGEAMISLAKATGNKVSIYLGGEARGARGYDYVIGTSADMLKTKKYYRVNKNAMNIFTNMYYVGKGSYYAACHAWTRDGDGKKKFGQWSELKEFNVTAVTPETPRIIDAKVSGSTVTITYDKCKNAVGYDIILGTAAKKVNGEMRPVNYGTLAAKVTDKNTLTVTFKNVKKGIYYAGLHAYSRTGPNKSKVFSPWSDSRKITVK